MIDLARLRKDPEAVIALLEKKEPSCQARRLYDLDEQLRLARLDVESLRHKKNELAHQAKSGITDDLREQSREIGKQLKHQESQLGELEQKFEDVYLSIPNIPLDDVPAGNKEANTVIREHGTKPTFDFDPKNHVELNEKLKWFDFETAAKISGSGFPLYKGQAVSLIYALTRMMMRNNTHHGYQPVLPPELVNRESLVVAGNFPKFSDQVYAVPEDNLYLAPTSEVAMTNMHRDEIVDKNELPMRYTAWTSCFRREAGGYGAHERGLIRIHQFEKVELYALTEPSESDAEQMRMVNSACELLDMLGLHYRVMLLAAQDTSFQAARTYDIEVWLPGQQQYYEVSSVSNCTDFQSRRGKIRFRPDVNSKTELVHTLNASSLALPRLMVALMETYQQKDGSITLPDVLLQYGL
jgi:seryl-tRNA synthetase